MKIVEQTPTKLTIKNFPVFIWVISFVFFGAFISGGAALMIDGILSIQHSSFTCKRVNSTQGYCQLIE